MLNLQFSFLYFAAVTNCIRQISLQMFCSPFKCGRENVYRLLRNCTAKQSSGDLGSNAFVGSTQINQSWIVRQGCRDLDFVAI